MTLPVLYYAFKDYWLPPEAPKPPLKKGGKPRRPKPRRPLPAEARWFLWQWSRVFGLDQSITGHVAMLSQRLGTTSEQWSRIMRMLKTSGVMLTSRVPRPSGRPLSEYRVSAEVRYDLVKVTMPDVCHRSEIARVLGEGTLPASAAESGRQADRGVAKPPSPSVRKHRLTPANRWLIAVLLAHAETPGRVSGLSYTRLGRLTGMSYSQLRTQLAKLREHRILADHQPGRRCRLFGSQMTPIFLFDLHHPLFGLNDRVGLDVVWYSIADPGEPFPCVVNGLVEALFVVAYDQVQATPTSNRVADSEKAKQDDNVVKHARALLPYPFDLGPLASRLARSYDPHTASWLLARVQGYAVQLLSHGWDTLSKGRGGPGDPVARVIDAIANDFPEGADPPDQAEGFKEPADDVAEGERDTTDYETDDDTANSATHALYAPHVTLIYSLAHRLADTLQGLLIEMARKPASVRLRDLNFSQVTANPQGRSLLERRGYVWRSPLERPMTFCLTPVDQGGKSLWEMRCCLRRGYVERPAPLICVGLNIVESDMTTWLSERPAIGDPGPTGLPVSTLAKYVFDMVLSQPMEPPEGE